jgi:hypothetical protein
MKTKALLILLFLGSIGSFCQVIKDVPVAISPGITGGVGVVENRCPTFSWSGVAWAQKYRVVVFRVEDVAAKVSSEIELTAKPLLSEDIAGGGLSWTPSVSQGLAEGADYSWSVGAMDASGAWAWSEPRRFRVEASSKLTLSAEDRTSVKEIKENDTASVKAALQAAAGSAVVKVTGKKGNVNGPAYGSELAYCTFYGLYAGASNSNIYNMNSFFGSYAGYVNYNGVGNSFMGYRAGYSNSSGEANSFFGCGAGDGNTIGSYNTFIGTNAGTLNVSGSYNTYLGYQAGWDKNSGSSNTYLGYQAGGCSSTGSQNIFIGYYAGYNETGSSKLYIANSDTITPLIYGDFSTSMVGINGWLGVGTKAPAYPMELKTTDRPATFVASRTGGASNFINATTTFGQFGTVNNYAVRILVNSSWRLALNADNSLAMASGASCTAGGVWTNASSIALKENITKLTVGEAETALQSLNPVKYNYKADKAEKYVGFIAEEVPALVAMNDRKSLSPMDIVAVLTKVVQEQQQFIQQQQKINEKMKKEITELKEKHSK